MNCNLPGSSVHGVLQARMGVGCHSLLQRILPTQGVKLHLSHLLHWQAGSLALAPPGKPQLSPKTAQCLHLLVFTLLWGLLPHRPGLIHVVESLQQTWWCVPSKARWQTTLQLPACRLPCPLSWITQSGDSQRQEVHHSPHWKEWSAPAYDHIQKFRSGSSSHTQAFWWMQPWLTFKPHPLEKSWARTTQMPLICRLWKLRIKICCFQSLSFEVTCCTTVGS